MPSNDPDDDWIVASERREADYDLDARPVTAVIVRYGRKPPPPTEDDDDDDAGV